MSKPDDRSDNVQNIKEHIRNTQVNIANTKSTIAETDDQELRAELKGKNERREEAIDAFQNELEDEIAKKLKLSERSWLVVFNINTIRKTAWNQCYVHLIRVVFYFNRY